MTLIALLFFISKTHALLEVNQAALIENFDIPHTPSSLFEGVAHKNEKNPGRADSRLVTGEEAFQRNGGSLALDYSIAHPGAFTYVWFKSAEKGGEARLVNLEGMNYLSFWRKLTGNSAGKTFEFYVEFREDTDRNGSFDAGKDQTERLPASRFAAGREKGGWQKIVVPLARFKKITGWDRILQIAFILENKGRLGEGGFLIDDLLAGTNFPEGYKGEEIPMQNRTSSFKINHRYVTEGAELKKKEPALLNLTLTYIDPYLEEIRWEAAGPEGGAWRTVKSFYDHTGGGEYEEEIHWEEPERSQKAIELRAVGISLLGEEAPLAGPFRITFD